MNALVAIVLLLPSAVASDKAPKRQLSSTISDVTLESTVGNIDGLVYTRLTDLKNHVVCYAASPSATAKGIPALVCMKE